MREEEGGGGVGGTGGRHRASETKSLSYCSLQTMGIIPLPRARFGGVVRADGRGEVISFFSLFLFFSPFSSSVLFTIISPYFLSLSFFIFFFNFSLLFIYFLSFSKLFFKVL